MAETRVTKDLDNNTLIIERTFDAPIDKLWQAHTDKDMFEKWWGPEGWETTAKEFDFKPGGRIHYGMKCVDKNQGDWFGQTSWGLTIIDSVDKPNGYKGYDYFSDESGKIDEKLPPMAMEVDFKEEDGKTTVTHRAITDTPEQLEEVVKMGMAEGFDSQLNRLEKLLQS